MIPTAAIQGVALAIQAGFAYAEKYRETMNQANRDRLDAVYIASWERLDKVVASLWDPFIKTLEKIANENQ